MVRLMTMIQMRLGSWLLGVALCLGVPLWQADLAAEEAPKPPDIPAREDAGGANGATGTSAGDTATAVTRGSARGACVMARLTCDRLHGHAAAGVMPASTWVGAAAVRSTAHPKRAAAQTSRFGRRSDRVAA